MSHKRKKQSVRQSLARTLAAISDDIKLMIAGQREARNYYEGKPGWERHHWYFEGAVDFSGSISETLSRRLYEIFEVEEMQEILTRVEAEDGSER